MDYSVIIWIIITISFTTYFIVSFVYKKLGIHNLYTALLTTNGLRLLNLKHIIGIVLFGFLFFIITPEYRYLIYYIEIPRLKVLIPLLLIIFVCAYLAFLSIRKYKNQDLGVSDYSFSNAWLYFGIRFTFLFCYEFFFRGVLFFKLLEDNSLFLAITYNTILYVLIHFFDSKKEIIGTIPFGVVLCLFTYLTNSIWYAFIIHLTLSAVYEITMFYYQTTKISKS